MVKNCPTRADEPAHLSYPKHWIQASRDFRVAPPSWRHRAGWKPVQHLKIGEHPGFGPNSNLVQAFGAVLRRA
jgi:hypothetical protein